MAARTKARSKASTAKAKKRAPRKPVARKRAGRPSVYSSRLAAVICLRIAAGDSLRVICAKPAMPALATVMRWLFNPHPEGDPRCEFRELYARARQAQAELYADDIIEIADNVIAAQDTLAKARLKIDTRKWIASKLLRRYADKLLHEHGGKDEDAIKVEFFMNFGGEADG